MLHFLSFYVISASPLWVKCLALLAGCVLLENATVVLAAVAVSSGILEFYLTFSLLYLGGCLGDLFFYFLGVLASKWHFLRQKLNLTGNPRPNWTRKRLWFMVFLARLLPGARTPLYLTYGFYRLSFGAFAPACFSASFVWTVLAFEISFHGYGWVSTHGRFWQILSILGFLGGLFLVGIILKPFRQASLKEAGRSK